MSSGQPSGRKQQIITAASELFRTRGYHNVSVADVGAKVDITASALYRHFKNKNELLYQTVCAGLDPFEDIVERGGDLAHVLAALAANTTPNQGLSLLWLRESRHLADEQRRELRDRLATTANGLARLIEVTRSDLSAADCELLAYSTFAVLSSTAVHPARMPRRRREAFLLDLTERLTRTPFSPMGPPTASVREFLSIPTSRREQLLTAAIKLFDECGYQSVNLDAIGDAAGRTGPNMYNYFDAKIDLLVTAVTRGLDRRAFNAQQAMSCATSPLDALRQLLRAQASFALEDKHLIGLMASELDQLPEQIQKILIQENRDYQDLWMRVLDAVRPGLDEAQAKSTIHAVLLVVANGARVGRLRRHPALATRLVEMGMALLLDSSDPGLILCAAPASV